MAQFKLHAKAQCKNDNNILSQIPQESIEYFNTLCNELRLRSGKIAFVEPYRCEEITIASLDLGMFGGEEYIYYVFYGYGNDIPTTSEFYIAITKEVKRQWALPYLGSTLQLS